MRPSFELSAPHNWCDRRCERCPLATSCPVAGAPPRDLTEILEEALACAEALCREQGIDPDEPVERPPPSLERLVLERAASSWAHACVELAHHVPGVPWRAVLVAGKVARVADATEPHDQELWEMDTIPNLLVLEHVLASLRADVDRSTTIPAPLLARFRERDATLRSLLAPLFATISALDRAILSALATHGRAPSPFATSAPPALP